MLDQTRQNHSVLILGHDARMVLPIVRSLGRHGLNVDLAYCPENSPAAHSKYIRDIHNISPPEEGNDSWISDLKNLIQMHNYQLVIPACESIVYHIQCQIDEFKEISSIYRLNQNSFETAFDKIKTGELAQSLNIPVPNSVCNGSLKELNSFLKSVCYPIYVKPACSVGNGDFSVKNFVQKASSFSEGSRHINKLKAHNIPVLIQQEVSGTGTAVEFLAKDGEILLAHQHRRLHETSGYGSTYRISETINSELYDATSSIIKSLNYSGVGMCEFRMNETTKEWWFIELNARFWGSLPLASASGIDFPLSLYEMLVNNKTDFSGYYKVGTRCRNLRNDFRWSAHWLRQFFSKKAINKAQDTGWKVNEITLKQLTMDSFRLIALSDHQDIFSFDDIKPGLFEIKQITNSFMKKLMFAGNRNN